MSSVIAVKRTVFLTTPEEHEVIDALVAELRAEWKPDSDSISLLPWTCRHGVLFEDHYEMEVVHELGLSHGRGT